MLMKQQLLSHVILPLVKNLLVETENAYPDYGLVMEMMTAEITQMRTRITAQPIFVRNPNLGAEMVVVSSMLGSVTTRMIVGTERMNRIVTIPNVLMVNSRVITIGAFPKLKFVMV